MSWSPCASAAEWAPPACSKCSRPNVGHHAGAALGRGGFRSRADRATQPLPLRPSSFVVTIAPGEDRVFALDVVRDADCFSPFLAEICALQRKLEAVEIKARVVQPEMADEDRRYHFRMTGAYLASLQAAGDSYGDRTSETLRFVAERVEQGNGGEARVIAAPGSGDLLH